MHARLVCPSVLLALLALPLLAPSRASAGDWESPEHNVGLEIPEFPAAWTWQKPSPQWSKFHIIKAAERVLTELKSGEPANGEMGLVQLVKKDAPEGATAAALAKEPEHRRQLMARFGKDPGAWPKIDVDEQIRLAKDHPAVLLKTEGPALNVKTGEKKHCVARMLITVAKGQVYYLRMYAWPTEHDDEGLVLDLDVLESGLRILDPKDDATEAPLPPPEEGNGDEETPEEEREPEDVDWPHLKLRLTVHKKLLRHKDDEKDTLILKCEEADNYGSFYLHIHAKDNNAQVNGVRPAPENIRKWITTDWWANFTTNHPEGAIKTFKWPRTKHTFLTVPDLADEGEEIVVVKPGKEREIGPSAGKLEKMKIVQAVKRPKTVGKKGKVIEPWRGAMQGARPRVGVETILRFAWRHPSGWSYRIFVGFTGKGYQKWGEAVRETLHTLQHYKRR